MSNQPSSLQCDESTSGDSMEETVSDLSFCARERFHAAQAIVVLVVTHGLAHGHGAEEMFYPLSIVLEQASAKWDLLDNAITAARKRLEGGSEGVDLQPFAADWETLSKLNNNVITMMCAAESMVSLVLSEDLDGDGRVYDLFFPIRLLIKDAYRGLSDLDMALLRAPLRSVETAVAA